MGAEFTVAVQGHGIKVVPALLYVQDEVSVDAWAPQGSTPARICANNDFTVGIDGPSFSLGLPNLGEMMGRMCDALDDIMECEVYHPAPIQKCWAHEQDISELECGASYAFSSDYTATLCT
eukprot:gene6119-22185_t